MSGLNLTSSAVLIEGHNLTLSSGTGIATYARQLAATLGRLKCDTSVLIGSSRGISRKDQALAQIVLFDAERKPTLLTEAANEWRRLSVPPWGVRASRVQPGTMVVEGGAGRFSGFSAVHVVPHLMVREFAHFRRYGKRMRIAVDEQPRIFHATRPAPLKVAGCPNIYTLHDIVPLRLPYTTMDDKKLYLEVIRDLCRNAEHIVTVSEFSRQDIVKLTGISEDKITNTYQAVSLPAHLVGREEAVVANEIEALFGLSFGEYFLFVGALEPKKNVSRLIDAFAASGTKRPLIITGSDGWMNERDVKKIESERFLSYRLEGSLIRPERAVRRFPYLPLDHLVSLIRGARAVLFPSLYEGFGLPVLEAMLLGAPVLTSNVSSLPEIAGDAAICIDPYDIDAMARAIRRLDSDGDLRRDLVERGHRRAELFSPAAYEKRLEDLYTKLLS